MSKQLTLSDAADR